MFQGAGGVFYASTPPAASRAGVGAEAAGIRSRVILPLTLRHAFFAEQPTGVVQHRHEEKHADASPRDAGLLLPAIDLQLLTG